MLAEMTALLLPLVSGIARALGADRLVMRAGIDVDEVAERSSDSVRVLHLHRVHQILSAIQLARRPLVLRLGILAGRSTWRRHALLFHDADCDRWNVWTWHYAPPARGLW